MAPVSGWGAVSLQARSSVPRTREKGCRVLGTGQRPPVSDHRPGLSSSGSGRGERGSNVAEGAVP